ncbi:MAG TPA: ATP-binding cassette domain-containing protein [Streptosporangiaceae bacterium]|nr:ATP-binding cassette domain-containing protein [Streptosporangiaceae bacterium]
MTVRVIPEADDWPPRGGQHPPHGTPAEPGRDRHAPPVIELRGLVLPGHASEDHLDLMVWHGELVMLTGQPRSGRSALLNVLGLLDHPESGSYLLNGLDTATLRDSDRSALRGRQIGFIFQRRMILPTRSVLDNAMLPLRYSGLRRRQRIAAAIEGLDRVGLADRAHMMGWQLSAGEFALCAIARALAAQPSLLLCDDPTAGLDQATAAQVIALLAGLHREGRTVLIATADQLAAAYSSRSVQLGPPGSPAPLPPRSSGPAALTDSGAGLLP